MKRISSAVLLLALIVASGCLRVRSLLDIQADGSGRIELNYSVSTQAVRQLQAMRNLQDQLHRASGAASQEDPATQFAYLFLLPDEDKLRQALQQYADQGLTIEDLKVTSSGAWRTVDLKLAFQSLTALAQTEPFQYVGFDLRRDAQGNYVFYRASEPLEGYHPPDFDDPATQRLLSPIFAGFKVVLSLRTPGRVLRTTAPHRSTFMSEWVYDFARDPAVIAKIQTDKLVTIFDSTGLDLPEIRH